MLLETGSFQKAGIRANQTCHRLPWTSLPLTLIMMLRCSISLKKKCLILKPSSVRKWPQAKSCLPSPLDRPGKVGTLGAEADGPITGPP